MSARYALVILPVAWVLACGHIPKLEIRADSPASTRELISKSPLIVVGRAVAVTTVGPEVRSTDRHEYPLRLERITVQVENILRGTYRSQEMVFYRYGWSADHPMVGPWGLIYPGQRNVFFVDVEDGTLRSIIDLYPAQIEVLSGVHSELGLSAKNGAEQSIAEILLTPGENLNADAFSRGLSATSVVAMNLIGRTGTLYLLKALLLSRHAVIREQACLAIADKFYGQGQCLSELTSAHAPEHTRVVARTALRQNLLREAAFCETFAKNPFEWVAHEAGTTRPDAVFDVLQMLTLHSDPRVRQRACELIVQRFPSRHASSCNP